VGRPAAGMAPELEVSFTDPTDRPRVRPRSVAHTPRTFVPRTGPPKRSSPRLRDYFHEQEPRKIRRERRFGEPTFFGERAHSPYFGTVDFSSWLDDYHRWKRRVWEHSTLSTITATASPRRARRDYVFGSAGSEAPWAAPAARAS
jgi:hypothetical protein